MTELWHWIGFVGASLPAWTVAMTLWTGALLAFVWAVDWLLRRHVSPSLRVVFYAVVFVRAALPVAWEAPLSALGAVEALGGSWTASAGEAAAVATPRLAEGAAPVLLGLRDAADAVAPQVAATQPLVTTGHVLFFLYLLGALALLGVTLLARRRLARALDGATPAPPRVRDLAPECEVLVDARVGPLAFGVTRRRVVLPWAALALLDDDQLACVVAHERAHHRRRDPLLALVISLATALAWPLLPLWLAAARVRHLMELAADERALESSDTRTYGATLLQLASQPFPARLLVSVGAGVHLGAFTRLRGRLLALRHRPRLPRTAQVTLALAVPTAILACSGLERPQENCQEDAKFGVATEAPMSCEQLKQRATSLHDEAERGADAAKRRAAADAYAAFTRRCADDPDHAEMVYYHGELLWADASAMFNAGDKAAARERFAQAHKMFRYALALAPTRFTKDAAYAQLLALKNHLEYVERDDDDAECPRDEHGACATTTPPAIASDPLMRTMDFPETAYSDDERAMIDAYELFARHVTDPGDAERVKAVFHRAKLAMVHNRFDEAEPVLRDLLAGDGDSKHHVWAAEMLTDVLTIRWVRAAAPDKKAAGEALTRWVERVPTMALYKHEEAGKLRAAIPTLADSLGC